MSSARKSRIVERARPVAEIGEVTEALHAIAEAMVDVATALCYEAATRYTGTTAGEQRQIAAVMFHTGRKRFGGVKYDGQKISDAEIETLDQLWVKMTGGRLRR